MTRYTVTGRGNFPMDMLRRDHAYPATPEDATKLSRTFEHNSRDTEIVLDTELRPWKVNTDRWRSFGWDVTTENVLAYDAKWVAERRMQA